MFKFKENTKSHMSFVAHGASPNFEPKLFACLMVNNKWKLYHFENSVWQRIYTRLPEDATECSPTAEYEPKTGKWKVSFIAGGFEYDRTFYLYKIDDLENPHPEKVAIADVGFIWKNRTVYGSRKGNIFICDEAQTLELKFENVEYFYRISYNPNKPNELLISGQYHDGEIFSWICNPYNKTLFQVSVNNEPAYKMALFNDECFYAKLGNDFEDRQIVQAESYSKEPLDFDSIVEIAEINSDPSNLQMAMNLSSSAIKWAKSGFKLADENTLKKRDEICSKCEFWEASARLGFGKCLKCGCSSPKLKLASETCPINKW